jgi:hypothetical protein
MSSLHKPPLASWARTTPYTSIPTITTSTIISPRGSYTTTITPAQLIVTILIGLLLIYLVIPQKIMDWLDAYMELPYFPPNGSRTF